MSRYINVKWLQESLELADECKDCKRNVDKCVYANIDVGVVCNAVDDAPSIDIVFCKECRWGKPYSDKQLECDALGLGGLKFPDDFCSYGERE